MTEPIEQALPSVSALTDLRDVHSRLQQLFWSNESDPWGALKLALALSSVRQAIEILSGTPFASSLPQSFGAGPKPFVTAAGAQKTA